MARIRALGTTGPCPELRRSMQRGTTFGRRCLRPGRIGLVTITSVEGVRPPKVDAVARAEQLTQTLLKRPLKSPGSIAPSVCRSAPQSARIHAKGRQAGPRSVRGLARRCEPIPLSVNPFGLVTDPGPRRYPSADDCAAILVAADRTCCVCRVGGRAVQLHHIDNDRSNADVDNFAVLCVDCHNETLRTGGFGRQLNAAQIRRYRDEWNDAVARRLQDAGRESSQ